MCVNVINCLKLVVDYLSLYPMVSEKEIVCLEDETLLHVITIELSRNIKHLSWLTNSKTRVSYLKPQQSCNQKYFYWLKIDKNIKECTSTNCVFCDYQRLIFCIYCTLFTLFLYARLQTGRIMVWWCPSVRPSGSPSVHPSVRPSVRPSQFSALFSYMHWHIDLKFCVSLYFYARKIKFECHQFPSLFAGVMLLFNFKLLQICSFPHFSPTCFDILSSNFVYDFVLMYHRASLSVVILLQFLLELCLFVNLEYSKYIVFRTFLLHALTYWAEILHVTLFYCTTDHVRVSSICVNFCGSYAPFGT